MTAACSFFDCGAPCPQCGGCPECGTDECMLPPEIIAEDNEFLDADHFESMRERAHEAAR